MTGVICRRIWSITMTTTSAERIRGYAGPALLSFGFRPLFLLAGLWAALAMAMWFGSLMTGFGLPTAFSMLDWHAHELLFGYVPAVIAGFLLTAVPNWTGRLPVTGTPLLVLVLIWIAGRLAVMFSALIGAKIAAAADLAFLVALAAVIGREIVAGRNWRNLKVLVLVALLLASNAGYHIEAALTGAAATGVSAKLGIAAALLMIMVIGGRIVPSFTHNWLARREPGQMPKTFDRYDVGVIAISALALAGWATGYESLWLAAAFGLAALLNAIRLLRWAGWRTFSEPLVSVLHVAYFFIPLGFAIGAATMLAPEAATPAAVVHAWTAGAIGLMTLAVMTRASLGHTGQPLHATPGITAIYGLAALSAIARILAAFNVAPMPLLTAAALLWIACFVLFLAIYGPLLAMPRR
jgi:uncharacterized protein involved in response to NO